MKYPNSSSNKKGIKSTNPWKGFSRRVNTHAVVVVVGVCSSKPYTHPHVNFGLTIMDLSKEWPA